MSQQQSDVTATGTQATRVVGHVARVMDWVVERQDDVNLLSAAGRAGLVADVRERLVAHAEQRVSEVRQPCLFACEPNNLVSSLASQALPSPWNEVDA